MVNGGSVREDGSLFFIVEVVIVKRKHGACVQKTEHEEELYEREFILSLYVVFYVINLYKTSARSESFESKNNSI